MKSFKDHFLLQKKNLKFLYFSNKKKAKYKLYSKFLSIFCVGGSIKSMKLERDTAPTKRVAPSVHTSHLATKARKVFTVLIFLLLCINTPMARSETRDIMRINWGVNLKFIDEFTPKSEAWFHSWVFYIPTNSFNSTADDLILGDRTESGRHRWWIDCIVFQNNHVTGNQEQNADIPANVTNPRSLCAKFGNIIKNLLRMIHADHKLLSEEIKNIDDLLPSDLNRDILNKRRRGLINAIGGISHFLFGTATDEQVTLLESNVAALADVRQGQTSVFKKSISDLDFLSQNTHLTGWMFYQRANTK